MSPKRMSSEMCPGVRSGKFNPCALPAALIAALLASWEFTGFRQNTFTVTRFDDTAANVTYTNPATVGCGGVGDLRFEMLAAMLRRV